MTSEAEDNIRRRDAHDWTNRPLTKEDLDFVTERKGEIRYEFKDESMNSFLDRAYQNPPVVRGSDVRVVVPPNPATSTSDLMLQIKKGVEQFNEPGTLTGKHLAFAVLINPIDKMSIEYDYAEATGVPIVDLMSGDMGNARSAFTFEGCILQAASFVEERKYMVIGKEDYERLIERNREHLDG